MARFGGEEDVRRAIRLVEAVMRIQGVTKKDLDRRLGKATGYFAQVLSGRLELKFRHLTSILRALEVEPGVFFRALYPEAAAGAAGAGRALEESLGSLHQMGLGGEAWTARPAPPAALDSDELEKRIRAAIQETLAGRERPAAPPRRPASRGRTRDAGSS